MSMAAVLERHGYDVMGSFVCPGRMFFVANRGHPSKEDLKKAASFAKRPFREVTVQKEKSFNRKSKDYHCHCDRCFPWRP